MRHKRLCILPLILGLIFLTTSCGYLEEIIPDQENLSTTDKQTNQMTEESEENPADKYLKVDESDIIGTLALLPDAQKTKWKFNDGDSQANLLAEYNNASLKQVMDLMGLLEKDNWYLVENSAYKGVRSLNISYSMKTRLLKLDFTLDRTKAEWPPDVLKPNLGYQTPAFPFGEYTYYEEHQESAVGEDSTLIVYKGIDEGDVSEYEKMLREAGYEHGENHAIAHYDNGFCFVELAFHSKSGQIGLFVGQHEIAMVSLPPWPEPIPEHLVRILSPVAAVMTATEGEDQIMVTAEKMSLCDLYGFFKASEEYYGWSALFGQDEMIHQVTGFGLHVQSYDSDTQHWTLVIFDATQPNSTQKPDRTLSPATESQDDKLGVTEFGYRVTEGRYSEQDAMKGVLDEFGQYADMADWSDIKVQYGDDMTAFLEKAGVEVDNDVWVKYNGQRFDGKRHYFLARISATRDDFMLYDKIDNIAWLGSWYGIKMPVLAKVPADQL